MYLNVMNRTNINHNTCKLSVIPPVIKRKHKATDIHSFLMVQMLKTKYQKPTTSHAQEGGRKGRQGTLISFLIRIPAKTQKATSRHILTS